MRNWSTMQLHRNDWFVRHARRLLQERAARGDDLAEAIQQLRQIYGKQNDVTRRLRAMWALYSIDAVDEGWLVEQLNEPNEHLRSWAVRLLVDSSPPGRRAIARMTELAANDPSGLVRLYLASALQQLALPDRWPIAEALSQHVQDAEDRVQPLMIWYGIEAAVPSSPKRALALASASRIPLLRRHIARRLTSRIDDDPGFGRSVDPTRRRP